MEEEGKEGVRTKSDAALSPEVHIRVLAGAGGRVRVLAGGGVKEGAG